MGTETPAVCSHGSLQKSDDCPDCDGRGWRGAPEHPDNRYDRPTPITTEGGGENG